MAEVRKGAIAWKGNPTDVAGPELKVGDQAPTDFVVTGAAMNAVKGSDLASTPRIIAAVPSLDTPVCDTEMRRFNAEASNIPGVKIYAVSMDLPMAQKRWCGQTESSNVETLSDFKERSFGPAFGVLAPSVGLFVRAVFVIGADNVVRHVEYVNDIVNEPNYDAALEAAKALA